PSSETITAAESVLTSGTVVSALASGHRSTSSAMRASSSACLIADKLPALEQVFDLETAEPRAVHKRHGLVCGVDDCADLLGADLAARGFADEALDRARVRPGE